MNEDDVAFARVPKSVAEPRRRAIERSDPRHRRRRKERPVIRQRLRTGHLEPVTRIPSFQIGDIQRNVRGGSTRHEVPAR